MNGQPTCRSGLPSACHPPTVLVVDDESAIRESIALALEGEGYEVVGAENGAAALAHLRAVAELPCVILLDMMMPIMNGWQFLAERQGDERLEAVPIVVMSAFDRAAYAGDVAEVVVKPMDARTLFDVVHRFCGATARMRDNVGSVRSFESDAG